MIFDYYASLAHNDKRPQQRNKFDLVSDFVDECTVWSCKQPESRGRSQGTKSSDPKNEARKCYMKRAAEPEFTLPQALHFEPDFSSLPDPAWFGIEVGFTLTSPWYSKDDRPFHVLDNPVRKDRVFGVPFMSAAAWKGLLRWACRMQEGLVAHLESHNMTMKDWKEPDWITHLFGNEKGVAEEFRSGALVCHPTWFSKVGFEVINPHKRDTRAGTQPIFYEVVPAGTTGTLRLLHAPLPGEIEPNTVTPKEIIEKLIDSIQALLETYGFSAKRTAGWGAARVTKWTYLDGSDPITDKDAAQFKEKLKQHLAPTGGAP